MGKVEHLARVVGQLSDEQLDSVIAFASSLTEPSVYEKAPPEVHASIERGLADLEAGRTVTLDALMSELSARIDAKK